MNVNFLAIVIIISMFVDWVFQSDWQVINKTKWSKKDDLYKSALALVTHSIVYGVGTTLLVNLLYHPALTTHEIAIMLITLPVSHVIIDNKIIIKWILRFKGMSKSQINDFKSFKFLYIGIDQILHMMVLLGLAYFIK